MLGTSRNCGDGRFERLRRGREGAKEGAANGKILGVFYGAGLIQVDKHRGQLELQGEGGSRSSWCNYHVQNPVQEQYHQ